MQFRWGMDKDKRKNYLILAAALLIGVFTSHILRQQTFVDDKTWMRAMIPHHSSAIMVGEKAQLDDTETIQIVLDFPNQFYVSIIIYLPCTNDSTHFHERG